MASVGGLIGLSHRPAYTAAKHGIVGLTKSLARDLAPADIRVNAICPGVIRTPLTEQYFADERFEQDLAVAVPLRRYGESSDVAQAALYLASDMASYVTGVALPVDGGWLAEKSFVSGQGPSSFHASKRDGVVTVAATRPSAQSFAIASPMRTAPGVTIRALTPRSRSSRPGDLLTNLIASVPKRALNFAQPVWGSSVTSITASPTASRVPAAGCRR